MNFTSQISCCLRGRRDHGLVKENIGNITEIAANVVAVLRHAKERSEELTKNLNEAVCSVGWTRLLADSILRTLEMTLWEDRETLGPVLCRSYDDAAGEAKTKFFLLCQLARAHPGGTPAAVLLTVLALGMLAELAPKVVELLGLLKSRSHSPDIGEMASRSKAKRASSR